MRRDILFFLFTRKPEPEVCNVSCPPLGCPRGPCPKMCCSKGICDPCCVSKMPHGPSSLHPPRSYMPLCPLKDYAYSVVRLSSYSSSSKDINRGNLIMRNSCSIPHSQSGFQQVFRFPSYNLTSTVLPHCIVGSVLCWNV